MQIEEQWLYKAYEETEEEAFELWKAENINSLAEQFIQTKPKDFSEFARNTWYELRN
jgi:hypothetical protein